MKIAYIGIDLFLPALEHLKKINCEIVEIFTCPTDNFTEFNTGIIAFAQKYSVPCKTERITTEDFDRLLNKGCEAVICAGYYYKIPVYESIPTVNIHPSLLPYGRGSWPMPYDILYGNKKSGVTIHKITSGFDEGEILLQKEFLLSENENHDTLMQKVYDVLIKMLNVLVSDFDFLYFNATSQKGKAIYFPVPDKKMCTVNAKTDVKEADKVFRAFYGYECYYCATDTEYILIKPFVRESVDDLNHKIYSFFLLNNGYAVCRKENIYICN